MVSEQVKEPLANIGQVIRLLVGAQQSMRDSQRWPHSDS